MSAIEIEQLGKSFGAVEVLRDVNIEIASGEFVVLVGPSGCGKSTLLRMIAGLEEQTTGEIRIGGRVVDEMPAKSRDIAMVFQSYALYPHMSVADNMSFALRLAKVPRQEIVSRVKAAAEILGLQDLLGRMPRQLSGGQRQRVAMGRAIVRDPKCFLMDEPLSNLDAKLRVQMRTEVARIQRRLGTTMVYVTHDQTEAMTLGDRVAVMRAGIIQQVDSPATLYDDPVNLFVAGFIGSPSMNFLPGRLEGDKLELPFGTAEVPERLRAALKAGGGGGGARDVIVGARPEHFEDATIEPDRPGLMKFKAKIDVVESMGSELYVYFDVDTKQELQSDDLTDLAKDSGMEDLPSGGVGQHVVARLDSDSKATAGGDVELVLDTTEIKLFDPDGGKSLTYSGTANGAGSKAASAASA